MRSLILPCISALLLTACAGESDSDSSVVAPESAGSTSLEDCSNVSLSATRIGAAARTTVNTVLTFDNALAVWRMPVSAGQELIAELVVPDDKDYNIAFFDDSGNKLACADTEGNGVDETLEYTVSTVNEIWVKVWTPELPSRTAFTLVVSAPVLVTISDSEPNNTPATAQQISDTFTTVAGSLDTDNSDDDDYYHYNVEEGDVITVTASAEDDGASLIYVALADTSGNVLQVDGDGVSAYLSETDTDSTLSYTVPAGMTELLVWMAAQPGTATYSLQVQIK